MVDCVRELLTPTLDIWALFSHSSGVRTFSNCSIEDFSKFISSPNSHCLQNQPKLQPSYKAPVCGNGKLEEDEVCDCGGDKGCEQDPCCNPTTCGLSVGSDCASGPCCQDCKFKNKGEDCRPTSDECDVPEYCNGTSAVCEEDFFIQNGHPCGDNKWLCINGTCQSGAKQCQQLFGSGTFNHFVFFFFPLKHFLGSERKWT
ncbi:disintegrin and metalloproteinase domain-containing protein 2-like, partial [Psammomys obesus]|uniref:disintegrin and metalloproteinase domain-containing protein 2-like n=1 Tax=Psammomys obesus TaxID=48139 RepID=UPI0024535BC5